MNAAILPPSSVFSESGELIRYSLCWEDADVLLQGLKIEPGNLCLSIAGAGDNVMAMLGCSPGRLIAVDVNPAQIACLELRAVAYGVLTHPQLLELLGVSASTGRRKLYLSCRPDLSDAVKKFWDARMPQIEEGIGLSGRLERYFKSIRRYVLPLVHSRSLIRELLSKRNRAGREYFYDAIWNNRRWRWLLRFFASQSLVGLLGRDPALFRYVDEDISVHLERRIRHAMIVLDPVANPYLRWLLTGTYGEALPYALRAENFAAIRSNLDRLEWVCCNIEDYLKEESVPKIDRFNLSDLVEYLSPADYRRLLQTILTKGRRGGRLSYWNLLVDRRRPEDFKHRLKPLSALSNRLSSRDKAFFYKRFVVEEIL
ncbi:MAG: DUF3419 family protein [Gammaproteobacteria bacterium]